MELSTIGMVFFSTFAVFSALLVVTRKNPVYGALWLMGFFFSLSGLYVFLNASFLAAVQIFVYVGAVIVLYLFAIMMVNFDKLKREDRPRFVSPFVGGALSIALFLFLATPIYLGRENLPPLSSLEPGFGSTLWMAKELYLSYPFPIELASVLLIVALVGAFALTGRFIRKKPKVLEKQREKVEAST